MQKPMKKFLPLQEPLIRAYYSHAFPLAILATRDDYLPWFYSNYIQLHSWDKTKVDFYEPWSYSGHIAIFCPLLYIRVIDKDLLCHMYSNIARFIIDCVDKDYYVRVKLDDFFVPGAGAYQRAHQAHWTLVSGYDDARTEFVITRYDSEGKFSTYPVSFADVENAFYETVHLDQSTSYEIRLYKIADGNYTKFAYEKECVFDIHLVSALLSDYLDSENTSKKYRMIAAPRNCDKWGLATYEDVAGLLGSSTDWNCVIVARLLWEHKKCMLARIVYMEVHDYLDASQHYSEEYAPIEATADRIRLVILRNIVTGRPSDRSRQEASAKKVVQWVWEIAESENRILRRVLDGLV